MLPAIYGHQHVREPRERYPFAIAPALAGAARLLGVTAASSAVLVGDGMLEVRFGPWRLLTELTNIAAAAPIAPGPWWRALGVRLSADRGLGLSADPTATAVAITFRRPVGGIDPWGLLRHPWVDVTVTTPQLLIDTLYTGPVPGRRPVSDLSPVQDQPLRRRT